MYDCNQCDEIKLSTSFRRKTQIVKILSKVMSQGLGEGQDPAAFEAR